jgi:archaemetzincin
MRRLSLSICFFFWGCHSSDPFSFAHNPTIKKIYIQPFKDFSPEHTSHIFSEIKKIYPDVTLLKPAALPKQAWYESRKRYRADRLIYWLKEKMNDGEVIVGLTSKDISTTKKDVKDFGVMGLGFRPGKACVASTYRLNKNRIREQMFKVVIHELGHTQGIDHCPNKMCFMRDAKGGNPTDEEKTFCEKCRKVLIGKGWNL